MDDIVELAASLRARTERLIEVGLASPRQLQDPMPEEKIETLRSQFAPRHLSDELVEFFRVGPSWPILDFVISDLSEFEDERWLEQIRRGPLDPHEVLWSPRWILLGAERCVFVATTPEPARRSAILLCDLGLPGAAWPMFPSLRSMLWFLNQVAQRILDGSIDVHGDPSFGAWFSALMYPEEQRSPAYTALREAAVLGETDRHPGWRWGEPPVWETGWTLEWMTALGVGDLDIHSHRS